jgi:hypothetical protein
MVLGTRRLRRYFINVGSALLAAIVVSACASRQASDDTKPRSPLERAKLFRSLLEQGRYDDARSLTVDEPRRWFERREGEGSEWIVGAAGGPWAAWDDHFNSRGEVIRWEPVDGGATVLIEETNEYFQLLDRPPVANQITYFIGADGRVEGLLIRGVGDRPPGRTQEFLEWANQNDPEELKELMPGGDIDPSGDHPERFRALLLKWRAVADSAGE